ncbi:hypothetical protein DFH05DRAFT_193024 [Lentinula detonsa]|uniref:Uncharacterized protein n=1 Tax=Lentinula detonsa TaxID=2804962 RepID=A0A9W8PCM2_9AGAR|nr:hypothetical protein DFH05DRAFT_193024 [Lentinula detonsa]
MNRCLLICHSQLLRKVAALWNSMLIFPVAPSTDELYRISFFLPLLLSFLQKKVSGSIYTWFNFIVLRLLESWHRTHSFYTGKLSNISPAADLIFRNRIKLRISED